MADDTLKDSVEDIAQRLRDLADECTEKHDNMPEGLQQGDSGQLLEERADMCNSAADELDGIDFEDFEEPGEWELPDADDGESEEDYDDRCDEEKREHEEAADKARRSARREYRLVSFTGTKFVDGAPPVTHATLSRGLQNEHDAVLKAVRLRYGPSVLASWLLEFGYTPEHSERALDAAIGERGRRIIRELAAWSERRQCRT